MPCLQVSRHCRARTRTSTPMRPPGAGRQRRILAIRAWGAGRQCGRGSAKCGAGLSKRRVEAPLPEGVARLLARLLTSGKCTAQRTRQRLDSLGSRFRGGDGLGPVTKPGFAPSADRRQAALGYDGWTLATSTEGAYFRAGATSVAKRLTEASTLSREIPPPTFTSATTPSSPCSSMISRSNFVTVSGLP